MQRALAIAGLALAWITVAGLLYRRRVRVCISFFLYIFAVAVFGAVVVGAPALYTPELWMVKQGIYDSLFLGIALELGHASFAGFRGIADRARFATAALVLVSTVAIAFVVPTNAAYDGQLWTYEPNITVAAIWCLTSVALAIVWFQIPVTPLVRSILVGLVPILLIFTVYARLIASLGWTAIKALNLGNSLAYAIVAVYWAYAAWRRE